MFGLKGFRPMLIGIIWGSIFYWSCQNQRFNLKTRCKSVALRLKHFSDYARCLIILKRRKWLIMRFWAPNLAKAKYWLKYTFLVTRDQGPFFFVWKANSHRPKNIGLNWNFRNFFEIQRFLPFSRSESLYMDKTATFQIYEC